MFFKEIKTSSVNLEADAHLMGLSWVARSIAVIIWNEAFLLFKNKNKNRSVRHLCIQFSHPVWPKVSVVLAKCPSTSARLSVFLVATLSSM